MAVVLWSSTLLLLLSTQIISLVASQDPSKCGLPELYPDKRLDEKYALQVEFENGQQVAYKCAVGYRQTGGSRVSLCRNGQWETPNMTCTEKICGSAGDIDNGRYEQDGNSFGAKAYAKCNDGFVLKGESVRECLDNGWSGTIPTCEAAPSYPAVSDRRRIQCEPSRSWSARLSKCTVIKCPELKIPNSRKSHNRQRFNTTVKITCDDGFQLKGSDMITCAANGSWAPAVPTCVSVLTGQCNGLPQYPNAEPREEYLSLQQFESGATVRFRCAYGYRLTAGRSSIRCENGRWTPLEMRCEKRQCGSAGEIQNGRFQYTGVSFGDTATAECDEGYYLFGAGVRVCRGDGWDGRIPVCEIVHCPMPPEVPGAETSEHIEEPITYRRAVSYRCLSGTLIGAQDIYCTEKGTWSAPPPQCREISCPVPSVPFGSIIAFRHRYYPQHTLRITCNPRYKLEGSEWITCGINGKWTPELPTCVR